MGIEDVQISAAVYGRPRRPTALEREQGRLAGGDTGLLETQRCLRQAQRSPALEQSREQQRKSVRLRVPGQLFQYRCFYAQGLTIGIDKASTPGALDS